MIIKRSLLLPILFIVFFSNCNNARKNNINSPLATVIKLNAAEALMDFDEAKKYQDVNAVYGKYVKGDTAKPEDLWKQFVASFNSISNDRKFTNQTKYYNYDITETINNNNAEVVLKAKNEGANLQEIIYKLELRQSGWIIKDIEYKNKQ